MSKRKFIEKTVELLSDKLELLNVNSLNISPLKIMAVQLQVSLTQNFITHTVITVIIQKLKGIKLVNLWIQHMSYVCLTSFPKKISTEISMISTEVEVLNLFYFGNLKIMN
jgi:hypothetical protein